MKLSGALITLALSTWQCEAFVVGPRHARTISKLGPLFVQVKDDGSWKTDFLDRIPEVPAPAPPKKVAPKEAEPAPAPPPSIPSATTPIGISTEIAAPPPPVSIPEPPAPAPVVSAPPPPVAPKQVAIPTPTSPSGTSVGLPSDLPIPIIAGGALAVVAAATFAMRGSVDEREAAQSGGGTSSTVAAEPTKTEPPAASNDLSIPYHAAAQLAYEKSDKKMPYSEFEAKYEADAVADVKAKQKK